ncbi:thioesterase II family protein [Cyanothece sp. BG0011]|uniref:thioesterase II family protein n=1 Tax=Cyanothece sp. BG0011 TaxID=2082950 RepID=UPI000D1D6F25|nr:alpha/beta fold hydrolase [Cyanothece sp. BG0011]
MNQLSNPWILSSQPNKNASLRLFCFPCAGGLPSRFNSWSKHLFPEIEVCSLQLPGRGKRIKEPCIQEWTVLIETITMALEDYLDRPFVFLGHSLGALISYEVTHRLRQNHSPMPQHLFICGCSGPNTSIPQPSIHHLPPQRFVKELSQRYQAIPEMIQEDAELLQLFLPSLRADFTLFETYSYTARTPLDCPITVFSGLEDLAITEPDLWNWQQETLKDLNLHFLEGDHFFLYAQSQLMSEKILEAVSDLLGSRNEGINLP